MKKIIGLTCLFLLFFSVGVVQAQEEKYRGPVISILGKSDLTFEFSGKPGEKFEGSFQLLHDFQDENKKVLYYTYATDFEVDPENGVSKIFPEDLKSLGGNSLFEWVDFDVDEVFLDQRGQVADIPFSVEIPAGASPGSHYGMLLLSDITKEEFINQQLETDAEISGAGLGSRIGPNLIVTVEGEVINNVSLEDFYVQDLAGKRPLFNIFEYLPVTAVVDINNSGNVFARPSGNVFIYKDDITQPYAIYELNEEGGRILPNTNRQFDHVWQDASIVQVFATEGDTSRRTIVIDWRNIFAKFRFGKYRANLKLKYPDPNGDVQILDKTISFWVIPWKPILGVSAVALVVFYIGKRNRKR